MDHFDERQNEDFRNFSLGYLTEFPDIQFSVQLIQHLVFRSIRTDNVNELWFNVQGHLMRFGLQKYALVTGLRCGLFPKSNNFDQLIERRRLKERRLLHGFWGSSARKFETKKRRKEKEIIYTVYSFPIAMFGCARRFRRLGNTSVSESVNECHDFFTGPHLHVYATLCPTDAEAEQPYFSTLVPYDDPPVYVLNDIAKIILAPRQDSDDRVSSGGSGEDETSGDDDDNGQSESDRDGDDSEDCDGDDSEDTGEPFHASDITDFFSSTVTLEIQQHMTSKCTRLREFIAGMVAPPAPTTVSIMMGANVEAGVSDGAYSVPCPNEEELLVGTEHLSGIVGNSCTELDNDHEQLLTPIDDQQDGGPNQQHMVMPDLNDGAATEPSHAAGVSRVGRLQRDGWKR
ncbi:Hypothetical predicted protein [Olea europaea subsp. europaea]|uniref:DUF1985 domain-containing protein n=1 Tax=Olea europaea subsp. europaea TaxID=158383 RepID=A0A8S0PHQ4_OLEEU|nr:Hypothetical predicted protein [Olea europaea subsp. europaea]